MARQCVVLALVVMIPGFAGSAFAQAGQPTKAEATNAGFVNYYLVHAEHGPNWTARTDEESRKMALELTEDLKAALGSGQVTFSGVETDGNGGKIIAIIRTGDEPNLRKLLREIRSVAAGLFELRVQPWYSPSSTWPEAGESASGC